MAYGCRYCHKGWVGLLRTEGEGAGLYVDVPCTCLKGEAVLEMAYEERHWEGMRSLARKAIDQIKQGVNDETN